MVPVAGGEGSYCKCGATPFGWEVGYGLLNTWFGKAPLVMFGDEYGD